MSVGGYFSLGGRNRTIQECIRSLLIQCHIKCNCYYISEHNIPILVVEIFMQKKDFILKELTGEIRELEKNIGNLIPMSIKYKISYRFT